MRENRSKVRKQADLYGIAPQPVLLWCRWSPETDALVFKICFHVSLRNSSADVAGRLHVSLDKIHNIYRTGLNITVLVATQQHCVAVMCECSATDFNPSLTVMWWSYSCHMRSFSLWCLLCRAVKSQTTLVCCCTGVIMWWHHKALHSSGEIILIYWTEKHSADSLVITVIRKQLVNQFVTSFFS